MIVDMFTFCDIENNAFEGGACGFSDMQNVEVSSTRFLKNRAKNDGGAIKSAKTENLTIISCTFRRNNAIDAGGCMKIDEGGTTISDTSMEESSAGFGAVIRTERGSLKCFDVNFTSILVSLALMKDVVQTTMH